jgi:hypothetical protein
MRAVIDENRVIGELVTLEVTVKGARERAIRTWLGAKVMLLAAWIFGCSIDITIIAEMPKHNRRRQTMRKAAQ